MTVRSKQIIQPRTQFRVNVDSMLTAFNVDNLTLIQTQGNDHVARPRITLSRYREALQTNLRYGDSNRRTPESRW